MANTSPQVKTLSVPLAARGRSGSISLVPISPSDQGSPPFAFDVALPAAGNNLPTLQLPPTFTVSGALINSLGTGQGSFNARAFQGNVLVSNRILTMENTPSASLPGGFILQIPTTFIGKAVAVASLTVQFTPVGTGDPWLTLAPSMDTDLKSVKLPAYAMVSNYLVTVHGGDAASGAAEPVSGATVRMYATLDGADPRGTARFLRDIIADSTGTAKLSLIPGATNNPRPYTLSVVPRAGSVWAATCIDNVPVPWNMTPSTEILVRDVTLTRRPLVTGTVVSSTGAPVGSVLITATATGNPSTIPCLPGPGSTSVTTDTHGMFTLPLDPGRYQFDYDPPSGSSAPRATEFDVDVQGDMVKPFRLPAAALVEGDVVTATGAQLPNATIRLFETRCPSVANCGDAPILRAQTQSDETGHFRAIVAGSPN
jgi:hypothetical protein